MQIDKSQIEEIANAVAQAVVKALNNQNQQNNNIGKQQSKPEKTAYQKTEQLLYNYNNFKKILADRQKEIEELRKYGVPTSCAISEFVQKGGLPQGLVLDEERVDAAVRQIENSIYEIHRALRMVDNGLDKLNKDPYYLIIPMRYFEGRTLEDIGVEFSRDQATIGRNRVRLIKELSMKLFPDQVINEMLS